MGVAVKEKKGQDTMQILTNVDEIRIGGGTAYLFVKHMTDMILSVTAIVVLLIPMILVGIMIKMDSKGPAIFKQERLGKDGKPFVLYKFRSMVVEAEADGPRWADKNDMRCTRLGRLLRKTRIDELPQLFNILKGDMSIVGPRPERAYFYDVFETYIPGFRDRLLVKPGLTGHAQVNGGYDLLPEEKIVYDMEYIRNRSLFMDAKCILKTVFVVFSRDGAR